MGEVLAELLLLLVLEASVEPSTGTQVRGVAGPDVSSGRRGVPESSMLLDREWTLTLFLGRSAVDFERGRPILGSSPMSGILVCGGSLSRSPPLASNGLGDGEWLAKPGLEVLCRMLRNDLRKALELLRLQFQLGSSPAVVAAAGTECGLRMMEL